MYSIDVEEPVIIKGYCGIIQSYEVDMGSIDTIFNIVLRDRFDPRITIVMEDIRIDEIFKNTCS